jgi:hypothetical protein
MFIGLFIDIFCRFIQTYVYWLIYTSLLVYFISLFKHVYWFIYTCLFVYLNIFLLVYLYSAHAFTRL